MWTPKPRFQASVCVRFAYVALFLSRLMASRPPFVTFSPQTATGSFPDSIPGVSRRRVRRIIDAIKFSGLENEILTRAVLSLPRLSSRAADHLRELSHPTMCRWTTFDQGRVLQLNSELGRRGVKRRRSPHDW